MLFGIFASVAAALHSAPSAPGVARPFAVATEARVAVRIYQGGRVSRQDWHASPNRQERIIRDDLGREVRLRTIDYE